MSSGPRSAGRRPPSVDGAAATRPVYFALGGLSNTHQYGHVADRLGRVFPDYHFEVFPNRPHFDPPHRAEPAALARSLRSIWDRAGQPTG